LSRPIVLIPHLYRLAGAIKFYKGLFTSLLVRYLDPIAGEPVNVSKVTRVMCDRSVGLGAWITFSGDHTGLCDVKS
jgi:hypothetical protein